MKLLVLLLAGSQITFLWMMAMHVLGLAILRETKQFVTWYTELFFALALIIGALVVLGNVGFLIRKRVHETILLNLIAACLILSLWVGSLASQIIPYAIKM